MASFRTHIVVGIAAGYAAGSVAAVNHWHHGDSTPFFMFIASFIGSFLPDLDSDSGKPLNIVFDLASFTGACIAFYYCIRQSDLPLYYRIGIPPLVAVIIRYGILRIFRKFTVHRGIFHSIPAAAVTILAVVCFLRFSAMAAIDILAVSLAAGAGFVSHLILDELYSVGFDGMLFKPKSSLGSSLALSAPSVSVTFAAYLVLGILLFVNWPLVKLIS